MKLKISFFSFFLFLSICLNGQRLVNRIFFIFPKYTSIDTIKNKFPNQFILTLDSSIRLSNLERDKAELFPKDAKSFFRPSLSDIHLVDSFMKVDILRAVISGDSLLYVNNKIYTWNNDQPTDFYKYKANRGELYEKLTYKNRKRIKKSDKYYFGYINVQGRKRVIVLFDPKKIKSSRMGDIGWFDFCDPFVVDMETKSSSFGYFPM
jgi:hypothetical protein